MMRSAQGIQIFVTAVACVGLSCLTAARSSAQSPAADAAQPNTLTSEEQKAGWILLFDGKTTKGWRNFKQPGINPGWKVIDGALTRTVNGAGDIVTVDKYGSFELSLEYNISRGGNSGVMYHVVEEGDAPWQTGPEIQIVDTKEGHDPQLSGYLYDLYRPNVDATKPAGQWNHFRIIVTPQKCETYVNGVKYYEYVKGSKDWQQRVAKSKFAVYPNFGKATSGYIALQDHYANHPFQIAFRNIKIRPLPEN